MIKKVEESLLQLEQEFANLKSLVAYLDLAKEVVVENQNLTESFKSVKEKSDALFNSVSSLLKEVKDLDLPELENRLQEKFSGLGDNFASVANQFDEGIAKIGNDVNATFEKIESGVHTLAEAFESTDFQKRFGKIDDFMFALQQSVTNNQTRIESIERNIKDDFEYKIKDLGSRIDQVRTEFVPKFENIEDKLNRNNELMLTVSEVTKKQAKFQFIVLLSLLIICTIVGVYGLVSK